MKLIPLTRGQFATVSDCDYAELSKYRWFADWYEGMHGYYAKHSYRMDGRVKTVRMARIIMAAGPGQLVDHINHDTLDNRRENLRLCTHSDNQANRQKPGRYSSKYKGCYWNTTVNRWQVSITHIGHRFYLGRYTSEIDAAQAYDDRARVLHGEFAVLNFP